MPLESATYISDLDTSNPVGSTDKVQTLDDHVRLIKSTIKTTFPNISGAATATHTELNLVDGLTGVTGSGNLVASASPTLTGTLTAAAATFSNTVNVSATVFSVNATGPQVRWRQTNGAANNQYWIAVVGSEQWSLRAYDDALTGQGAAITIERTGTTIDEIQLDATAFDFNGNLDLSGTLTIGGNMTVPTGWSLTTGGGTFTISGTGETLATFADDGAVTLYHNNSAKLDTKADGVNVVGELECDTLDVDGNVAIDGTLTTPNTSASEVGYKGVPQNDQAGDYTFVLSDAGKHARYTGAGGHTFTIPANGSVAFPIGTVITIINWGAGNLSIAITTDNLYLAGTSFGTTGTRTLDDGGMATIVKATANSWLISGLGVS